MKAYSPEMLRELASLRQGLSQGALQSIRDLAAGVGGFGEVGQAAAVLLSMLVAGGGIAAMASPAGRAVKGLRPLWNILKNDVERIKKAFPALRQQLDRVRQSFERRQQNARDRADPYGPRDHKQPDMFDKPSGPPAA